MILVTTAIEDTWGKDDKLLFLGEWCKLYERKMVWSNRLSETLPYHWDDRNKLRDDFERLQTLNEDLLVELTSVLNHLHRVKHGVRYWRIVIGYWLNIFTAVLFDRWEMIQLAMASNKITNTILLNIPKEKLVANDSVEFQQFIESDFWNHSIYLKIIEQFSNVSLVYRDCESSYCATISNDGTKSTPSAKELIKKGLNWLSCLTSHEVDPFIVTSNLPYRSEIKLYLSLGIIPKFWASVKTEISSYYGTMREWQLPLKTEHFGFDRFVRSLLPELLPRVFLEGYKRIKEKTSKLGWPKKPKFIFTANSHYSDDVFKIWAAVKTKNGTPLITVDHGGFGSNAFNGSIKYQFDISDVSLSWGWEHNNYPQVKPFGIVKTVGKRRNKWDPNGVGLMVLLAMPRYSFDIRAMAISGQMLGYFEDQYRFYGTLPQFIRDSFQIRLCSSDYDWYQKQRWLDRFPDVQLDTGLVPLSALIEKSRLYISTYNATTYLESLSLNMPTIMFWNPNHWEIRDDAFPYFNRLKENGIFHETPESAAAKVAEVWDDVSAWWNQKDIQDARQYFCHRFARSVEEPIKALKEVLLAANA